MARELVIEAGRAERQYWKDLWRYRELFFILTWRDVAVQYKQTAVGILWAVLRPLLTMAAFTFVFAKVAKLPSEGQAPYPLMVFVAMLPLAVVCYRHFGHCKQPSCKQQSCFQGIFSPHYCTGCHHRRGSGGFCNFFRIVGFDDGLVPISAARTGVGRFTPDLACRPSGIGARAGALRIYACPVNASYKDTGKVQHVLLQELRASMVI